jgi:small-conductance mechanosensitive channel
MKMKKTKQIVMIGLIIILGFIAYVFVRTGTSTTSQFSSVGGASPAAHGSTIDPTALRIAERFAQMPTSADELPLAQEALRLGDREMDLAFAAAVRDVQEYPVVLNAEAKRSQAGLQNAQKSLDQDNAQVAQLTSALNKASAVKQTSLEDQLERAKVQAELDQDEVDNAKQELIRAGGDAQDRIEQLMKEHDAASRVADSTTVNTATPPERPGLIHHYLLWSQMRDKALQLQQAREDAESTRADFSTKRETLQLSSKDQTQEPSVVVGGSSASANSQTTNETSTELVRATRRRSAMVKALTSLDERIQDQKQLGETYKKWIQVVAAKQRTVIHDSLSGTAVVVAILLIGIFFDSFLKQLLNKLRLDRRQAATLHAVISTSLQIIAAGLILLVFFGPPSQLGTFLGLAGAGLTVALKDFIVSFFGWFVLMGRNGMRLGDWVEINGVTGEVAELGMFHTVLLETGNWTDSGHPTGRRVTFTNNFAIEGHYFNFSTSGQWLWDELTVVLASNQNPYPIVEAIQKAVLEATAESTGQAEKEWQQAAHSREMRRLSAAPAIHVKPVSGGVEVVVRYITRASERSQLRSKLYQAAMRLISGRNTKQTAASSS